MNDPSPALDRRDSLTEVDPYCLNCGYSLRGLSGDPLRCPECGRLNPMGPFMVPEAMVRRHLAQMRAAPLGSAVVCLMSIFLSGPVMAAAILFGDLGTFLLSLILPLAWFPALLSFRRAFGPRAGWAWALIRFHLISVGSLLIIMAVALMGLGFVNALAGGGVGFFAGLLPVIVLEGWLVHRALDYAIHLLDPDFEGEARRRAWEELRPSDPAT